MWSLYQFSRAILGCPMSWERGGISWQSWHNRNGIGRGLWVSPKAGCIAVMCYLMCRGVLHHASICARQQEGV